MRFASPEYLLLILAVIMIGIFAFIMLARKRHLLKRFADLGLLKRLVPHLSFGRQRTKLILFLLGLCFLVVAIARPQFGTHMEMLKREGIDIIVAVDVSNSMAAQDMKPNRLEKAKQELRGIIERLRGDRIGLIAFAGEAFIQCPLTLDYATARFLLSSLGHNSVSVQGTSISSALKMAIKAFDDQSKKHKVMLLLTDGEDHEGGLEQLGEELRQSGVKVYTVGIGNPDGDPIPIVDKRGKQVGFRKDDRGELILTRLDERTLRELALTTGGRYYHATHGEIELDRIFEEIGKMEKKELEGTLVTHFDDRYQWPLLLALILFLVDFLLPARKTNNRGRVHA